MNLRRPQISRTAAGADRPAAALAAAAMPVAGALIALGASASLPLAAAGVALLAAAGYRLERQRQREGRLLRRRERRLQRRLDQRDAALSQAQDTVIESERQLIGGIDQLIEAMVIVDAQGVIRHANPAANRMFGFEYGELTTQPVDTLRLGGSDSAEAIAWLHARARGPAPGDLPRELVTARHRNGFNVPLEVTVTPTRYDGEPRFCVILRDVTQRRSMERQLRQHRRFQHRIIELMPVAVFIKDARRLVFSEVNGAFEQFLGVPRADLVGRRYQDIPRFPADLARRFEAAERRMAEGGSARLSYHDVVQTANGEKTVRASMVPVTDDGGTVTHLLGVVENLTDEVAARRALTEQKQQAEHYLRLAEAASQAKDQFLANMGHELRTPLNAIIGYAEILDELARRDQREQDHADLARILEASRHLLVVINEILDLAQTESGRSLASFRPVNVAALIRDVRDTVEPLMSRNGNLLEISGESDGVCVSDDDLLRRILINLLGNASKFTSDGRVTLRYRVGPDQAWFQVSDTGIGIAAEAQHRIFEPFAQGDASISRIYGGTGLGLTLCQRFCRQLGGKLVLDSRPGEGATFTLTVPSASQIDGAGPAGSAQVA